LRALLRRSELERELDEELRYHIGQQTEQNIRLGMNPEEARHAAQKAFGGVEQAKERSRDARGVRLIEDLWQDLRYGGRMLAKNPGFTLIAVITLALGIGANTAIFSVVYGVMLRPLPYHEPERLVRLWTDNANEKNPKDGTSYPNLVDWRSQSRTFTEFANYSGDLVFLTTGDAPEQVRIDRVSANLFPLLGVQPLLGRTFSPEEEERRERVVVLSYGLWQRRFGGDPNVVGKTLEANGQASQVIGVMPAGFFFSGKDTQFWEPAALTPRYDVARLGRTVDAWYVIGRLKPGVSIYEARAEMSSIAHRLAETYPAENTGMGVTVMSVLDHFTGDFQLALWILFGSVVFVMLIACVNVATLLSARGATRRREFAIRTTLGAGRARLLRQLLTECLMLAAGAGLVGLGLAALGLDTLLALAPPSIPRLDEIRIDRSVLLFTGALSLGASLIFGLLPAWKVSRSDPNEALKEGSRSAYGGLRLRQPNGMLIVFECALAVALLTGAGLLIHSLFRLHSVDPGFRPESVLQVRLSYIGGAKLTSSTTSALSPGEFYTQVLERIAALPGVQAAGAIDGVLMRGNPSFRKIEVEGRPTKPEQSTILLKETPVSPGFFETMRTPLLRGRLFSRVDIRYESQFDPDKGREVVEEASDVVLINETLARSLFPGEDPIGKRVLVNNRWVTAIGVVRDMHRQGLEKEPIGEFFRPSLQSFGEVVLRTDSDPLALVGAIRDVVRSVDKNRVITSATTLEQRLGDLSLQRRFQTWLLTLIAALALTLSAIGIYGVIHYSVTQRTHEIGIRIALGARSPDVLRLVVGQGIKLALIGVAVGLLGAFWLTGVMAHLLFGVSATDPATFVMAPMLLAGVALLASWIPARRAAKVDPMVALRNE
jgi:putative ABC transport system permease protein